MRAFVINVYDFLTFAKVINANGGNNTKVEAFEKKKHQFSIPLYQREYTWGNRQVEDFVNDICVRDKFLGNIMLEEKQDHYDVMDGQQRLTTIILILAVLYNQEGAGCTWENRDQKPILALIKNERGLILKNSSVGEYLVEDGNQLILDIKEEQDIYYQNKKFNDTYYIIKDILDKYTTAQRRDFFKKLKKCELSVLLKCLSDIDDDVEKIFIDINFKLKSLEKDDIFKSHCFDICDSLYYGELKECWVKLYSCSKKYVQILDGFSSRKNKDKEKNLKDALQNYIYEYLLIRRNEEGHITKELKQDYYVGKNYVLDGVTSSDEILNLLGEMIDFGEKIIEFSENLDKSSYRFEDICCNADRYLEDRESRKCLKEMCKAILGDTQNYSKVCFLMLIYYLKKDAQLKKDLEYETWKKIVTNYYVYVYLFGFVRVKEKKAIRENVFDVLYDSQNCSISNILQAIQIMRKDSMERFEIPLKFSLNNAYVMYSIMDNYYSDRNYINLIYSKDNDYNQEHLIIPQKKNTEIWWKTDQDKKKIKFTADDVQDYKNLVTNSLIIPRRLNEELDRWDVVEKIRMIKEYFRNDIPAHVRVILEGIENLNSYKKLEELKTINNLNDSVLKETYKEFILEYFSDNVLDAVRSNLKVSFKKVFQNGVRD